MLTLGLGLGLTMRRGFMGGGGGVPATAPAQITGGQWTLTDSPSAGGDKLSLDITALPSDGGSPITALQWRVSGGAAQILSGLGVGERLVTVLAETAADLQVRAVNAIGSGPWSDIKTVTPTVLAGSTGFASNPTLRGDFLQGQVIYSDYAVSDPLVVAVQDEWLYNGVVIFGELNRTYALANAPTVGDTIQHRARTKNGTGWDAWVTSDIKTYATPAYLTTRYFGANTFASDGGFPAPAGATSITNAGGTNLILSSGSVVPATDGVTSGTITFNTGVSVTIIAVPNARSVATIDGMRTAMQAAGLVRGTHKILMRGGVDYNPTRARKDVTLASAIGGTPDVGYVEISPHTNEPKPVIWHIGFQGSGKPDGLSEFGFRFTDVIFGGTGSTDADLIDANVQKSFALGRSGGADNEKVRGLAFVNCYFGTFGTDAAADWKRRLTGFSDQSTFYFCRFINCVFDRVAYALQNPMHCLVQGCLIERFSRDAILTNMSGAVFAWNEISRAQPVHEGFVNPTVLSNAANNFVIDVTGAEFIKTLSQSSREDGRWTILSGDGDLAAYVGVNGSFVGGSTVQNGTSAGIQLDLTGVNFATVTNWEIRLTSWHTDAFQSTRRDGVTFARSPVLEYPEYVGCDAAFIGNILNPPDWPNFSVMQCLFSENQNGLDSARTFLAGNNFVGPFYHGIKLADQGSGVAFYNTVTSGVYPNNSSAIGFNSGDGVANAPDGLKQPEDSLMWNNIAHAYTASKPGGNNMDGITQGGNQTVDINGANLSTLFIDPQVKTGLALTDPLFVRGSYHYRVSAAMAAAKVGAIGNPDVSFTNRTLTIPPIAYGGRVDTTEVAGTLQVSGRNLAASDDVYWLLSNSAAASYTAAQIKAAGNGGALPSGAVGAGKKATQSPTARWTDTVAGLPDASYKLHSTADRDGALADAVVTSSPLKIVSNAAHPTLVLADFKGGSAAATGFTAPALAASIASSDLLAFSFHRGYGTIGNVTINGVVAENLATDLNLSTGNIYSLRRIANPNTLTSVDAILTGLSYSAAGGGAIALLSSQDANTYQLAGVAASPTTGATNVATTASVLAGDIVVAMLANTSGDFGAITWTGLDQLFATIQGGTSARYAALASKVIAADNAAYPLGAAWPTGRNNVNLVYAILRKV